AREDTGSGVAGWAEGKSGGRRSRPTGRGLPPEIAITAGAGGRCASELRNATVWPSAVTAGLHTIPPPLVSGVGVAAFTGTLKRCRRSMSLGSGPALAL